MYLAAKQDYILPLGEDWGYTVITAATIIILIIAIGIIIGDVSSEVQRGLSFD